MRIAESYSLIIIPKDRAKVKRWILSRERIVGTTVFVLGLLFFGLALSLGFVHYRKAYLATAELRERGARYEQERTQLLIHLNELASQVEQNGQLVSRLEQMVGVPSLAGVQVGIGGETDALQPHTVRLAALDPNQQKGLGGSADLFDETTLRAYQLRSIDLMEEAKDMGERLKAVYQFNGEAEYFWTALPTIAPTRGWITSDFGLRRSPLTGARQLHEGIDIASPFGAPVTATGDGMVTFTGRYGGLGKKIVIDHGYGLATVYGHNAQVLVEVGDRVQRGQIIAKVGTTGRSTGPHLHYEVLINGVPVNPNRFMLEHL